MLLLAGHNDCKTIPSFASIKIFKHTIKKNVKIDEPKKSKDDKVNNIYGNKVYLIDDENDVNQ